MRLLLRPPDEQHPLGPVELGQKLMRQVVFALPLDEVDHRHMCWSAAKRYRPAMKAWLIGSNNADDANGLAPMAAQERHHPLHELQARLVDVEVHPVDALHLQGHMLGENISSAAR